VWVFFGKQKYVAEILYVSETYDLAILKVKRRQHAFFSLSTSDNLARGTTVVACGFPDTSQEALGPQEELEELKRRQTALHVEDLFKTSDFNYTGTHGFVSRIRDEQSGGKLIQHNAPISHGNSGGPLLMEDGVVVGINTWLALKGQGTFYALGMPQLRQEIERHVQGAVWK